MTDIETIIARELGDVAAELFHDLTTQSLSPADVIIFLQGDRLDRLTRVRDLYRARYAPKVYLTGNNAMMERRAKNDENDMYLDDLVEILKKEGVPASDTIVDSNAMNTADQAVHAIAEAKKREWQTMLVVTSPYHVLRTYLSFVKQARTQEWQGEIRMAQTQSHWDIVPSGRSKTALQMLEEEIEKIARYKNDLATIEDARAFFLKSLKRKQNEPRADN